MKASFAGRFFRGASYHLRAIAFLREHPELKRYLVWPILISVLVGGALYAAMLYGGWLAVDALVARLPEWLAFMAVVLHLVLMAGLLVVTGILVAKFGVILGAPWYGKLAEQLETIRLGPEALPAPAGGPLSDVGQALGYELRKLVLTIGLGLPLLVVNLVPVAGSIISTVGGVALGVTILCLDFLDPALGRRRLRFRAKLKTVYRHMPTTGGFGLVSLALVGVPLVNLLTVPLSVTAATLLYCDEIAEETTPARA